MMFAVAAALTRRHAGIRLAHNPAQEGRHIARALFFRSFSSQSPPLVVPVELVSDTL